MMKIDKNTHTVLAELKKQYEERVKIEPRHRGIIELENRIKRYEDMIKNFQDMEEK